MLLARGADIEHVDGDGYSVLAYLWEISGLHAPSACQTSSLKSTQATAEVRRDFQRATAIIGTAGDIDAIF